MLTVVHLVFIEQTTASPAQMARFGDLHLDISSSGVRG
jgi:hypothetical protein